MLLVLLELLALALLALLALLVLLSMSSHLVPGVDDEIYIFGSKGNRWARGAQPPRPRPALQPMAAELTSPFSPCATQKSQIREWTFAEFSGFAARPVVKLACHGRCASVHHVHT